MEQSEIEISVMDGPRLVQKWACTRVVMPNGAPGVLWRGVAYPLLSDDRIDVSLRDEAAAAPPRHALLPGEDASWILIQGLPSALDRALAAIRSGGVTATRSGRWLGEPVGGIAFDWFIRCPGALDAAGVAALLGGNAAAGASDDPVARIAVLEQRLADLRADMARLAATLRRASPSPVQAPAPSSPGVPPDAALQEALAQIADLQARLREAPASRPSPRPATTRIQDELRDALGALRPDIVLLRDSLIVATGEFQSRAGFYRAVTDLPAAGSRPKSWKMLRGAERWWERHVTTGRDDSGRAYARFDTTTRQWSLLLSWKAEQARDIVWLRQQG